VDGLSKNLIKTAEKHLSFLCNEVNERHVGSKGNQVTADYLKNLLEKENFKIEELTTLGMTLVRTLADQLDANFDWQTKRNKGTTFRLTFKPDKIAKATWVEKKPDKIALTRLIKNK
jgi:hypothetical protein